MHEIDEHSEAEEAEDDGRHGRQIVDVDLDQIGQFVLRRELLEIDRGGNADRQRQDEHDQHHVDRADNSDAHACRFGPARCTAGEKPRIEALFQNAIGFHRAHPFKLLVGDLAAAFIHVEVDLPLHGRIHIAAREHPHIPGRADDRRVRHHHVAQLGANPVRDQTAHLANQLAVLRIDP